MYTDILRNEHFNNLAAIIRVAFLSAEWKAEHARCPFWTLNKSFVRTIEPAEAKLNRKEVIKSFTDLITAITQADDELSYTAADLDWFVRVLDGSDSEARAVLNLFTAWYSAQDELLTPAEVAEKTGTNESNWRNKAASGEIPGAVKKGKQWLLPRSVLRARGLSI